MGCFEAASQTASCSDDDCGSSIESVESSSSIESSESTYERSSAEKLGGGSSNSSSDNLSSSGALDKHVESSSSTHIDIRHSSDAAEVCYYQGITYNGDDVMPNDGCNTCVCDAGRRNCTNNTCGDCSYDTKVYDHGNLFNATDGCNQCGCVDGSVECTDNGCDTAMCLAICSNSIGNYTIVTEQGDTLITLNGGELTYDSLVVRFSIQFDSGSLISWYLSSNKTEYLDAQLDSKLNPIFKPKHMTLYIDGAKEFYTVTLTPDWVVDDVCGTSCLVNQESLLVTAQLQPKSVKGCKVDDDCTMFEALEGDFGYVCNHGDVLRCGMRPSTEPWEDECDTNSDCEEGYACTLERKLSCEKEDNDLYACTPTCAVLECAEGYTCEDDACIRNCTQDSECLGATYCDSGTCVAFGYCTDNTPVP